MTPDRRADTHLPVLLFSGRFGRALAWFSCAAALAADGTRDGLVRLDKADCSRLVAHSPSADTAYRPGVDVRGKPVAPADLGDDMGKRVLDAIGDEVVIDLEVLLADRFDIPLASGLYKGDVQIGTVIVRGDEILLNGISLLPAEAAALAAACQRR